MKGIEFAEVRDAITLAFNADEFDMFLYERLDFDRPVEIADGPFRVVVTNVLRNFMQHGLDAVLIAEVAAARPLNGDVQNVYRKYAESLVNDARREVVDNNRIQAMERYGLAPRIHLQKTGTAQLPAATTPGEGFEKTIKKHLPFLDVATWRMLLFRMERCVCRVEIGNGVMGSGFLVGPDVLLTNYHVMKTVINQEAPANGVRFRFDYYVQPNGQESPGVLVGLHGDDWNVDYSPFTQSEADGQPDATLPTVDELDHALVRLERPLGTEDVGGAGNAGPRGWIQIPPAAPAISANMPLLILQHPNTEPLKLALDTDGVLSVNQNQTRVRYATNTEGGSSGSPCFDIKWNLLALHHYGDPAFEHPAFNQGIPIAVIRQRLQSQGKDAVLGGPPPG